MCCLENGTSCVLGKYFANNICQFGIVLDTDFESNYHLN